MATVCTSNITANITNFSTCKSNTATTLNSITSSTNPTQLQQDTLNTAANDIFKTVACLNEKIKGMSALTNDIQRAQESIININKQITEAEENVSIARDRVAYIRNPEKHTSFYESWFPLTRPMEKKSIPILIAINTFLFIAGIFLIMTAMGLRISFPLSTMSRSYGSYGSYGSYSFKLSDGLLLILVGFIVYYFLLRK